MKRFGNSILFGFLLGVGCVVPVSAGIIGTAQFVAGFGYKTATEYNSASVGLFIGPSLQQPSDFMIWSTILSNSDQGRSFRIDNASDPEFAGVVSMLTNGVNDWIADLGSFIVPARVSGGVLYRESDRISCPACIGPDFAGQTITALIITVTDFRIHPVDNWSPLAGIGADTTFTVEVESAPEPSLTALFAGGCLLFVALRLRNRRRKWNSAPR